jgi:pimeloyl-ACP methyl ester carboxylesterase
VLSAFAGGALFGARHGEGPPRILALHGWGRSHRDWAKVLEGLDAVSLDLPGFGASPPPPKAWGLEEYAHAVAPLLDEVGPVVLAGHSFGGSLAVQLATDPITAGGVKGLLITGSPLIRRKGSSSKPPLSFRLARRLNRLGLVSDQKMEELRRQRGSADYRNASGVMRDTLVRVVNQDVADRLAWVTVPTRLVWGEGDGDVPVAIAREAAAAIPGADLSVLAGVGHDTLAQAPDQIRKSLMALLEDQTPNS